MQPYLQTNWQQLTHGLPAEKDAYFQWLCEQYTSSKRYYHTLEHIAAMLQLVDTYVALLTDKEMLQFTIWYHDAVYKATKNTNEAQSAKIATEHLSVLGVAEATIANCTALIHATKSHTLPPELNTFDAKFLLNIDLAILAASQDNYFTYTKQIRKEYGMFPDILYKPGRKKVLQHFLQMERIYKTDIFFELYENQAKDNLALELSLLS